VFVQTNEPSTQAHISEPHVGNDDFPMPDDQTETPERVTGDHESDDGYETALDDETANEDVTADNEDMASETDTAGSKSEGTTTLGNQDDGSIGASTNTYDSRQSNQSKSVDPTSQRSQSSDDDTNATDLTAATPPRNNRKDMECDSDDDMTTEDANLICPHPEHFTTFWRADFVTAIPTNTNPILTVALKLGETLAILQTIDKDTSVYPYESNPRLKPIQDPAAFQALGTELYAYADKNNLWKYPKKEMKTCRLILCLAMNSDFRSTCETFNRVAEDSQLYPRALNYPRMGRAGFFPMSHPHQMSEGLLNAIRLELKRPIGLDWRKAVPSIDLSDDDAKPGTNGRVDIPAAITVECRDGDEATIRQKLTELFPAIPRTDRFTYLCGIRMVFIHAYNPKEKDTVLPESRDNVARAWSLQKSANQRMRTASLNGIVRNPSSFDLSVTLDTQTQPVFSLKSAILSLKVPYMDTRKEYAPVFESVEYTRRRVLQKWENPELFVVFLPQHEKYASNVIENLAMHLSHQLRAPEEYLTKLFRRVHMRQVTTKQWNKEHAKVFSPAHMSAAISDQHMAHHFADLNLDMSLVLQDAAKKTAAAQGTADAGSIPKASESQHLSIGMASLLGEKDRASDIFYRSAPAKSTPVSASVTYASMVTTPTTQTAPTKSSQSTANTTSPTARTSRSRSRSSQHKSDKSDRQRQSSKAADKADLKPAAKRNHKAPSGAHTDELSTVTAADSRPPTVATISVGNLSVDPSSITTDTAALLQAQHEEMQAKLAAQESKFRAYIQSLQQSMPPNQAPPPIPNSMSETAQNSGGGPAL
jgi:hypothetical protein